MAQQGGETKVGVHAHLPKLPVCCGGGAHLNLSLQYSKVIHLWPSTLTATLGATLTATVSASLGPHAPLTPLLLPCPRQPLLQVPQVQLLRLTAQREKRKRAAAERLSGLKEHLCAQRTAQRTAAEESALIALVGQPVLSLIWRRRARLFSAPQQAAWSANGSMLTVEAARGGRRASTHA